MDTSLTETWSFGGLLDSISALTKEYSREIQFQYTSRSGSKIEVTANPSVRCKELSGHDAESIKLLNLSYSFADDGDMDNPSKCRRFERIIDKVTNAEYYSLGQILPVTYAIKDGKFHHVDFKNYLADCQSPSCLRFANPLTVLSATIDTFDTDDLPHLSNNVRTQIRTGIMEIDPKQAIEVDATTDSPINSVKDFLLASSESKAVINDIMPAGSKLYRIK